MRILILLLLSILTSNLSSAQITSEVRMQFPTHILVKIETLMKKVKLTPERQMHFGFLFSSQDSIAEATRKRGGNIDQIISEYNSTQPILPLLNPLERNDYEYVSDTYSDWFTVAIKHRDELKLSDEQLQKLLQAKADLEKIDYKVTTWLSFNYERLQLILDQNGLMMVTKMKNSKKANELAVKRWKRYSAAGITREMDSVKTLDVIKEYEVNILAANEMFNLVQSPENLALRLEIREKIPALITKLEKEYINYNTINNASKALKW